jgi:hypothetical protein
MILRDVGRTVLTTLAGVTLLAGGYSVLRPRRIGADTLPRWTCGHAAPPVDEVPADLLAKAGFHDAEALRQFTNENRAALHWTYFSIQNALRAAEEHALSCFAKANVAPADGSVAEARLTWHLKSDAKTAVGDEFAIARVDGAPALEQSVRNCLAQHLVGKRFVATALRPATFLTYDGTFPFFRQLRFSPKARSASNPTASSRRLGSPTR